MARVHGVRRLAPSYAGRDGICSSCKRGFHTRLRLVHHLSYSSPQCLEWCMLHRVPMTDQDREVLHLARMLISVVKTNERAEVS